jgi:hypothetical protein
MEAVPPASSLPSDYKERIRATASALEQSALTPSQVRSAANCVMNLWRGLSGLPTQVLATINPSQLTLSYLCSGRFVVRNQHDVPVDVQYDVNAQGERVVLDLLARPNGAAFSEARLLLDDPMATVRLWLDGVVIQTVTGTGSNCH